MIRWWVRLLYSFFSLLLGAGVVGILANRFGSGLVHFGLPESVLMVIVVSIPGWLVAVPLVLFARNYDGRRFWTWGAVGLCIGPGLVACLSFYGMITSHQLGSEEDLFLISATVSALCTFTYLLLVRLTTFLKQKQTAAI